MNSAKDGVNRVGVEACFGKVGRLVLVCHEACPPSFNREFRKVIQPVDHTKFRVKLFFREYVNARERNHQILYFLSISLRSRAEICS